MSADLTALGRTPVAVVCAGIKSILDIGRTLEYLETQGVPVLTVGKDRTFPAFFTSSSGHEAPHSVPTPVEAARVIGMYNYVGTPCKCDDPLPKARLFTVHLIIFVRCKLEIWCWVWSAVCCPSHFLYLWSGDRASH